MSKFVAISDQVAQSGKWVWKDDTNTLEFIGNTTGGERQVGKRGKQNKQGVHFPDHGSKRNDRATPSSRFARERRSGRQVTSSKGDEVVTLHQVKMVAYDLMVLEEEISPNFERLFLRFQFDEFLSCLFNYFHFFFEKKTHEEKPNPMNIEPSAKEKRYYAELCANVEGAQKLLGSSYCVLVMGIGLGEQHHMARGMSRVSNTYQDRSTYETLYRYCAYAVWVAFKRKDRDAIKKEISRMLRSDTFNPAIRVKNAPESDEEEGEKKKLTPAEYRRVQGKRPPIKSIITQRSPALVSILPSPKEEANYLFKFHAAATPTVTAGTSRDEQEDVEDHLKALHLASQNTLKLGIIGEPLSNFNKATLMPNDAEQDGEEADADGEKAGRRQSSLNTSQLKNMPGKDGSMSREATGMSATTVEALPDED